MLGRLSKAKYYSSIKDLPIALFDEIGKTGNVDKLAISGRSNRSKLTQAWKDIMNQFIAEFGLNDSYKQYLSIMAKVMKLNADIYIKGQKWKKIQARSKHEQAKALIDPAGGSSLSDMIADISKNMGFRVDPMTTSVFEFYGYLKHINKINGR